MRAILACFFVLVLSLSSLLPLTEPVNASPTLQTDPWEAVRAAAEASEIQDVVIMVGNAQGNLFSHSKGVGYPEIPSIPITSASKWWAAATILMLVEEGSMSLDDRPQDYISWWTNDPSDPRSRITLEQLLSLTSGFILEVPCLVQPNAIPEECAREIYDTMHANEPSTSFFYSSNHLQIAGVMAELATGEGFVDLFRRTIGEPLGMQPTSNFTLASADNPWLAGGGTSSPVDYARYLEAIMAGEILANTLDLMLTDHTPLGAVELLYSPVQSFTEWHYGLGVWKECPESKWVVACESQQIYSSPGGTGWLPWIDFGNYYYGLVATYNEDGLLPSGELAFTLRPLILEALSQINTAPGAISSLQGSYNWFADGRTFDFSLYIDGLDDQGVKGRFHWQGFGNTVTAIEGELITDLSQEADRWEQLQTLAPASQGDLYIRFTEETFIQGSSVELNTLYYGVLRADGSLISLHYLDATTPEPLGSFEARLR